MKLHDLWKWSRRTGPAVAALFVALPAHADISGRVVGVSDGDTITVLDVDQVQHKVRLAGIDAPEKKQAFGQKSKEALSDCAYGQKVEVQGSKLDRYGRLIGKVLVREQDCNLRQIRLGMAWHYKLYMKEQTLEDRILYANEENTARINKLGLWIDPNPVPPWDFRHH